MTITTNLLPDLNPWEYDALKERIRRWKVILPVVKDENGDIIDGYQRVRVCNELGITDYPVLTLRGLTEDDKRDHSLILNLVRRRLNQQQMRKLIAAELKRTPDLSDNWLAQILGTTDKTVAAVRQKLIATSEIPKLDALRGKDGRYRRVTRITTNTANEAKRAQQALQILGDDAPCRDLDLRQVQSRAKRKKKDALTKGRQVEPPGKGNIKIYHCPFQRLEEVAGIKPNSVNLVLTDIPYGQEFLPQVGELAAFAARVLVEGGLLVTYTGQFWLRSRSHPESGCSVYKIGPRNNGNHGTNRTEVVSFTEHFMLLPLDSDAPASTLSEMSCSFVLVVRSGKAGKTRKNSTRPVQCTSAFGV